MEDPDQVVAAVNGNGGMKEHDSSTERQPILVGKDKHSVMNNYSFGLQEGEVAAGDNQTADRHHDGNIEGDMRAHNDQGLKEEDQSIESDINLPIQNVVPHSEQVNVSDDLCSALSGLSITKDDSRLSIHEDKTEDGIENQAEEVDNRITQGDQSEDPQTNLQEKSVELPSVRSCVSNPVESLTTSSNDGDEEKEQVEEATKLEIKEGVEVIKVVEGEESVEVIHSGCNGNQDTQVVVETEQVMEQVNSVTELVTANINEVRDNDTAKLIRDQTNGSDYEEKHETEDIENVEKLSNSHSFEAKEDIEMEIQVIAIENASRLTLNDDKKVEEKEGMNNSDDEDEESPALPLSPPPVQQVSPVELRGRPSSVGLGKDRTSWLYAHMLNETPSDDEGGDAEEEHNIEKEEVDTQEDTQEKQETEIQEDTGKEQEEVAKESTEEKQDTEKKDDAEEKYDMEREEELDEQENTHEKPVTENQEDIGKEHKEVVKESTKEKQDVEQKEQETGEKEDAEEKHARDKQRDVLGQEEVEKGVHETEENVKELETTEKQEEIGNVDQEAQKKANKEEMPVTDQQKDLGNEQQETDKPEVGTEADDKEVDREKEQHKERETQDTAMREAAIVENKQEDTDKAVDSEKEKQNIKKENDSYSEKQDEKDSNKQKEEKEALRNVNKAETETQEEEEHDSNELEEQEGVDEQDGAVTVEAEKQDENKQEEQKDVNTQMAMGQTEKQGLSIAAIQHTEEVEQESLTEKTDSQEEETKEAHEQETQSEATDPQISVTGVEEQQKTETMMETEERRDSGEADKLEDRNGPPISHGVPLTGDKDQHTTEDTQPSLVLDTDKHESQTDKQGQAADVQPEEAEKQERLTVREEPSTDNKHESDKQITITQLPVEEKQEPVADVKEDKRTGTPEPKTDEERVSATDTKTDTPTDNQDQQIEGEKQEAMEQCAKTEVEETRTENQDTEKEEQQKQTAEEERGATGGKKEGDVATADDALTYEPLNSKSKKKKKCIVM